MAKHTSIKMTTPSEAINITPINPMISKCYIKVCYVDDDPNRNKSVINKETAKKIANSLPGSPIVGFFNEYAGDFEEHNKAIEIKNNKLFIKEVTRPYGFVDFNAKCWFQKFLDDGKYEREYLVTEGWLWTGQYPEAKRIVEKGNNQSMNLDNEFLKAHWAKDKSGMPKIFIVNEAVITNLCILGEEFEPCFEGSQISGTEFANQEIRPVIEFSFDESTFRREMYAMMKELKDLKEIINKGGSKMFTTYSVEIGDSLWTNLYNYGQEKLGDQVLFGVYTEEEQKFAIFHNVEDNKFYRLNFSLNEENEFVADEEVSEVENFSGECQFSAEAVAEFKKKKDDEEDDKEDKPEEGGSSDEGGSEEDPEDDDEEDEDKKKKKKKEYSLDEIPEYQELLTNFNKLNDDYNQLKADYDTLTAELEPLKQFKLDAERKEKEAMIANFYMLSDEDKADVVKNIDTYSLDDIEAKLSIICVRNKVSFALEDENNNTPSGMTFNFGDADRDADVPAWVKAAMEVAKDLN